MVEECEREMRKQLVIAVIFPCPREVLRTKKRQRGEALPFAKTKVF
jgi:hypothetical protein